MNLQESGDFRADDRVTMVMRIDSGEKKNKDKCQEEGLWNLREMFPLVSEPI